MTRLSQDGRLSGFQGKSSYTELRIGTSGYILVYTHLYLCVTRYMKCFPGILTTCHPEIASSCTQLGTACTRMYRVYAENRQKIGDEPGHMTGHGKWPVHMTGHGKLPCHIPSIYLHIPSIYQYILVYTGYIDVYSSLYVYTSIYQVYRLVYQVYTGIY